MAYVEFLRVRRALVVYAIVVTALVAILTASLNAGHVRVDAPNLRADRVHIPLTMLFAGAAFASLIFCTILSGSLNRERETLALGWTRPIARERFAAAFMLVDFGGVLLAFLFTLVVGTVPIASTGFLSRVYADPMAPMALLSVFGVTVMWYGIVQAATAWYRGRAGLVVGLSWAAFAILIFLGNFHQFGPLVPAIANALDYLNPLAYLSSFHFDDAGSTVRTTAYIDATDAVRTAASWAIGIAACVIAIFAWKRAEA